MYRRGGYTKTPWRNTIMEKTNIYLIPPPLKLMVDQQH
jgi:hypothetical protein